MTNILSIKSLRDKTRKYLKDFVIVIKNKYNLKIDNAVLV